MLSPSPGAVAPVYATLGGLPRSRRGLPRHPEAGLPLHVLGPAGSARRRRHLCRGPWRRGRDVGPRERGRVRHLGGPVLRAPPERVEAGEFVAAFLSPPCSTFSAARARRGGPGPLRGELAPDIYGLKGLAPSAKEKVRIGTLLALRACSVASAMHDLGQPWSIETPEPRPGHPSVFKLPELVRLAGLDGVSLTTSDQCTVGSITTEPTALLGNMQIAKDPQRCSHPPRWWRIPWSGEEVFAPRPPLKGHQLAAPWDEWGRRCTSRRT